MSALDKIVTDINFIHSYEWHEMNLLEQTDIQYKAAAELAALIAELEAVKASEQKMREALKNALMNEGQDACCLPRVNPCHCWRCQARRALKGGKG